MNEQSRTDLLLLARSAMVGELGGEVGCRACKIPDPGPCGGVFVTLRNGRALRGCMGTFRPSADVVETVEKVAKMACRDSRFKANPVTREEMERIRIEISVLSLPVRIPDPLSLRIGDHGILIRRGASSGCFLPQVAVECGWGAEELLSRCCSMKAGLPPDAWKHAGTDVSLFTTETFGEGDPDEEG